MNRSLLKLTFATLTITAVTAIAADAGVTTTVPGYVNGSSVEKLFETRGRVDTNGSWKTAIWQDPSVDPRPVTEGATMKSHFNDGQTYEWSLDYDGSTGIVNWSIEGLDDLSWNFQLDSGKELVGFHVYARALDASNGGTTIVDNMDLTYAGQTYAVPDEIANTSTGQWPSTTYYFDSGTPFDAFSLTGNVTFDWLTSSNTRGERYKFGFKAYQGTTSLTGGSGSGTVIPSPAAIWAGLTLIGYTVMRRNRKDAKA